MMDSKWQCPICKTNHNKDVIQCYCGQWKDDYSKGRFIRNYESVFKAINILNKHFVKPKKDNEISTNRNLGELILAINLNENTSIIDEKIILFGKWVLEYLGCKSEEVLFHIYRNKKTDDAAGKYDSQNYYGFRNIIINLDNTHGYYSVVYTVAHECMHHFLIKNGIVEKDENANEVLADVAVIYFGFGEFLEKGCKYKLNYSDSNHRLGYLSDDEIAVCIKYLEKRRKQIDNYRKIMSIIHIEKLDVRYQELYNSIGESVGIQLAKEQVETIRMYSNALEDIKNRIKTLENKFSRIKETNKNQIIEVCKEADGICESIEKKISYLERILNKRIIKNTEKTFKDIDVSAILTVKDIIPKTGNNNSSYFYYNGEINSGNNDSSYINNNEKIYSGNHRVLNDDVNETLFEKIKNTLSDSKIFVLIVFIILFVLLVVKIILM